MTKECESYSMVQGQPYQLSNEIDLQVQEDFRCQILQPWMYPVDESLIYEKFDALVISVSTLQCGEDLIKNAQFEFMFQPSIPVSYVILYEFSEKEINWREDRLGEKLKTTRSHATL